MFSSMLSERFFVQKSIISQKVKKSYFGFKSFVIYLRIQIVKSQNLIDLIADDKLKFDMLLIRTTNKPKLVKFDILRRQK